MQIDCDVGFSYPAKGGLSDFYTKDDIQCYLSHLLHLNL